MIVEYVLCCDRCHNEIVVKYDEDSFSKLGQSIIGSKDFFYCVLCGDKQYHTVISEYSDDDELQEVSDD